jgi:polyisoprenyl-phosphate glycosyltransferase
MNDTKGLKLDLSIIIPIHNEEEVLPLLIERLDKNIPSWGNCEIILVNDGSTDGSYQILNSLKNKKHYKVIHFTRNFGHQAAMTAGMEHIKGANIVMMDADLQDPPEFVTELLKKQKEGFDIVYAVRKNRKEGLVKRFFYRSFYVVMRYLAYIDVPLDAGDFCVMSKRVVETINAMPERNRFIRGLRVWTGFKKSPLEYDRHERKAGDTKYPFLRLVNFGVAGIMSFSTKPLRVSSYVGVSIAALSFLVGLILIILKLTVTFNVSGWASLMLVVFFLGGVQLLVLGVIGEYIGLIYMETQHRPLYVIKEKIGL